MVRYSPPSPLQLCCYQWQQQFNCRMRVLYCGYQVYRSNSIYRNIVQKYKIKVKTPNHLTCLFLCSAYGFLRVWNLKRVGPWEECFFYVTTCRPIGAILCTSGLFLVNRSIQKVRSRSSEHQLGKSEHTAYHLRPTQQLHLQRQLPSKKCNGRVLLPGLYLARFGQWTNTSCYYKLVRVRNHS